MLKNILKLDGAQKLSKNEQKSINGGIVDKCRTQGCLIGYRCTPTGCVEEIPPAGCIDWSQYPNC